MKNIKVTIEESNEKDDEHIFHLSDGECTMSLSERDIMLVLITAKAGGIYLDVDNEIYSQAINDALQVISGCPEPGSYNYVERLLYERDTPLNKAH